MADSDLIKSVKTIFSDAIGPGKRYFVPSYQRGYKWNRENVFKLLNDLKSFEKSNRGINSFYCLQNITIVPLTDGTGWNVVDGQQRLTTLYILLSYLRKTDKDGLLSFFYSSDCLKYNVRTETGKFLEESVFTGNIWEKEIDPNSAEWKDQWYILDVAGGIKQWFDKENNSLELSTVTERLKLIVNNMSSVSVSEEKIFAGLNGGKVDLDGADLLRAILITRSAKEKYSGSLAEKVKEFRMRIALELDEMNLWWSQKEQKTFFEQFLPGKSLKSSIFNHDAYPIDLLYKLYFLIYHEEGDKFGIEFFENGKNFNKISGDDHWELYESLMSLQHTLKKWFCDPLLYHWIGYLIFRFKERVIANAERNDDNKKKETVNLRLIWKLWESSRTKEEFLTNIISRIQLLLTNEGKELDAHIRDVKEQWYEKDSDGITNVLVLMDVMICTGLYRDFWCEELSSKDLVQKPRKIRDMKAGKIRLPASYFTKNNENFEHIRSCAPNQEEGKEERRKDKWVKHIKKIYSSDIDHSEVRLKTSLLQILENYSSDELNDTIINKLNDEMNKFGQHSIGNLALLDEHINKSYGNDSFQKKIQRIFNEFMKNEWYIRPYTMIVFEHKIEDEDKSWRWTQQNIRENAANIANNIDTIIKLKLS